MQSANMGREDRIIGSMGVGQDYGSINIKLLKCCTFKVGNPTMLSSSITSYFDPSCPTVAQGEGRGCGGCEHGLSEGILH